MEQLITAEDMLLAKRCRKAIYLKYHKPHLQDELSLEQKAAIKRGDEVGEYGRLRFQYEGFECHDVTQGNTINGAELIEATQKAIYSEELTIFGGQFLSKEDNLKLTCSTDIISKTPYGIRITENKSGLQLKLPQYILDTAFQWRIIKNSGYKNRIDFQIAYLNKDYIKNGNIDTEALFVVEDISRRVQAMQPIIDRNLFLIKSFTKLRSTPTVNMGAQCWEGYPCPFISYCQSRLAKNSVMNITSLSASKRKYLLLKKYKTLDDLPRDASLTPVQWAEVDAMRKAGENYDKEKIKKIVRKYTNRKLQYFIDMEAFMPAIPIYDACKPYTHLSYQYCIIRMVGKQGKFIDRVFPPGKDPRREFIESLLKETAETGVIVTYNKAPDMPQLPKKYDEKPYLVIRLTELAEQYPDLKDQINERINRVIDLSEPFVQKYYYHPLLKGSNSLKNIAALWAPDVNFNSLQVNNSEDAKAAYSELIRQEYDSNAAKVYALKGYLKMCVIAIVRIAEKLEYLAA